jgi:hypothetical protein
MKKWSRRTLGLRGSKQGRKETESEAFREKLLPEFRFPADIFKSAERTRPQGLPSFWRTACTRYRNSVC